MQKCFNYNPDYNVHFQCDQFSISIFIHMSDTNEKQEKAD